MGWHASLNARATNDNIRGYEFRLLWWHCGERGVGEGDVGVVIGFGVGVGGTGSSDGNEDHVEANIILNSVKKQKNRENTMQDVDKKIKQI